MRVAIMQPYFIPYLGYFQLVNSVDTFIFYDDVNFIKKGWINRNNILVNNEKQMITIPCLKVSQNKSIREIEINQEAKEYKKILKTIQFSYEKAPYFNDVFPLFNELLNTEINNIAELASSSIIEFMKYLDLKKDFKFSSINYPDSKGMNRMDRLIHITKSEKSNHYINTLGGQELYDKKQFEERGVKLDFIQPILTEYNQFKGEFVSGLSFLDVLMFNPKEKVQEMLGQYKLV